MKKLLLVLSICFLLLIGLFVLYFFGRGAAFERGKIYSFEAEVLSITNMYIDVDVTDDRYGKNVSSDDIIRLYIYDENSEERIGINNKDIPDDLAVGDKVKVRYFWTSVKVYDDIKTVEDLTRFYRLAGADSKQGVLEK